MAGCGFDADGSATREDIVHPYREMGKKKQSLREYRSGDWCLLKKQSVKIH